ncbi:BQ2448_8088 [Microbotryum intermedium]|uniref:Small nuclear ribonucleoprotein E n=1 Tax=Microbotryum intermedium TaxID=269621 RepID=A0A238FNU0_9BASI|nr:BQ2448_8088 [Microbotryum intermedium]
MSSRKVMVQPINVIFKHLQSGTAVQVWLYDNLEQRLEGKIIGFDEFMNVVLDDAQEVWIKDTKQHKLGQRQPLGRLLLKGENISLIQMRDPPPNSR